MPKDKLARPETLEEDQTWPYPEDPYNYEFWGEKMYVKVQNYKDAEGA